EHEKDIYTILNAAVRQALGKHNMVPSIDFNRENEVEFNLLPENAAIKQPGITVDPNYNPFKPSNGSSVKPVKTEWEKGNWVDQGRLMPTQKDIEPLLQQELLKKDQFTIPVFKIFGKYLMASFETKVLTIHIRRAIERVYFEYLQSGQVKTGNSQQLLFPESLQLSPVKFALYSDLKNELVFAGFEVAYAGENTLNITGVPAVLGAEAQAAVLLEQILDEADKSNNGLAINVVEIIQRKLAYNISLNKAKNMNAGELQELVADLMQTTMPTHTPSGLPVFYSMALDEIEKRLG
ncbi:MAG TPA: hypothetical protein VD905_12755, partial [Flavobacteriales bacterium]|nr:hypothetical protein [Flavobacteriales bacterium]